ncbi:DUF1804 family protein [Campylobacter jejuni]|uniref:DUF1804 family protein n=2 Tax=Campylobacter TaxID=194 RepID=A0A5Y1R3E2_CAMJU|nr:DUF1804 family protein [Campylobacter jejuni]EAH4509175.1 DUF1804 family protein [Campylobacter jejuni]EAI1295575.1 DUF1804 family protein [Campylobacter jejuni]EAI3780239.1 DUF1804 family protein [Campylobacter jejuni]EAI3992876.1 DUF1804 family protein [Campylobacter jejuni]EAI8271624.1 DUF1804 family protein [Campylobacter jejuni]
MAKNLTSTTKPKMAKVGCGLQVGAESETPARKDKFTSSEKSQNNLKDLAKELYIAGFDIFKIAKILNRNEKTIRNYKAKDGDWDKQKANLLTSKIKDKESASLYESFTEQMFCAIENINTDEKMNAEKKTEAIARIGDSFSKMRKVARLEDPSSYRLNVAKKVVEIIISHLKNDKDCVAKLVSLLESGVIEKEILAMDI